MSEAVAAAIKRWLTEPLVAFALFGTGLFLLFDLLAVESEVVTIPAPTLEAFEAGFLLERGRAPGQVELERAMASFRREEVLFREALRRGLHLEDGVVRKLLVDRMSFIFAGVPDTADISDLVNYYAEHIDRYHGDRRVSFGHRFFANEPEDPARILAALRAGEEPASDPHFWLADEVVDHPLQMLANTLGTDVVLALLDLTPGQWSGPYRSTTGQHYLRLHSVRPRQPLPFEQVRDQVERDWRWEQRMAAIDREIAGLPTRYYFVEIPADLSP